MKRDRSFASFEASGGKGLPSQAGPEVLERFHSVAGRVSHVARVVDDGECTEFDHEKNLRSSRSDLRGS